MGKSILWAFAMTYKHYVFLLCAIVYILLLTLSVFVIVTFTKMMIKLIIHGAEDAKIKTEYAKVQKKRKCGAVDCIVSVLCAVIFAVAFSFSLYVNIRQDKYFDNIPTFKVVNSGSMSKKHEKNTYLFENNLNDQFQTFDMILTYKIPPEEDLQLYDIVVYEVDGGLVVHRIVGIIEPNEFHPNERHFLLQGDAVETPDRFPVRYNQMQAIYRGKRIPYIGSFVSFLQSPAGWMCMILIVVAMVAMPILEKKIEKAKAKRFALLSGANPLSVLKAKGKAFAQVNSLQNAENNAEVLPPIWGAPVYLYPVYHDTNGKGGSKQ